MPIDDEHTLSIAWIFDRVPNEQELACRKKSIPAWRSPIKDPLNSGQWIASHVMNQDFIAWVGQGTIADRTKEHLGRSDRGVVMLRKRLMSDLKAIADGTDPSGLIRDAEMNKTVELPIADRALLKDGLPAKQLAAHPIYGRHQERFVFPSSATPACLARLSAGYGPRTEHAPRKACFSHLKATAYPPRLATTPEDTTQVR